MKKTFFLVAVISLILTELASAQFGDVLNKVKEKVTSPTELFEEKNITTSITDAYPIVPLPEDMYGFKPREITDNENSYPSGYYFKSVESYCLKAGTHGPYSGAGYLLAPILGKKASLVKNILEKRMLHPEIKRTDVQHLLWAIIYGTKFKDLPAQLQINVTPLLTPTEIADLNVDIKEIAFDVMPSDVKSIAEFYRDFRKKLADPTAGFSDIEQMAIRTGIPPLGPGSKDISAGKWFLYGNEFFVRIFPIAYYNTIFEFYRPDCIFIQYDNIGRIISIDNQKIKIELNYDDEPTHNVIKLANGTYAIWRIKQAKFSSSGNNREIVLQDIGWLLPPIDVKPSGNEFSRTGDPLPSDFDACKQYLTTRIKKLDDFAKSFLKTKFEDNAKDLSPTPDDLRNIWIKEGFLTAVESLMNLSSEFTSQWQEDIRYLILSLQAHNINALTYNDKPQETKKPSKRNIKDFDNYLNSSFGNCNNLKLITNLTIFPPANTSAQRLAMTMKIYHQDN
ncbi:MAG: hypothetical protein ACP5P3_06960 [Ignavibacteria bacterium]